MELWIRSQDKRDLIKTDFLYIAEDKENNIAYIGDKIAGHIAEYKSKERALEVLDEIQNILIPIPSITQTANELKIDYYINCMVYEMPLE